MNTVGLAAAAVAITLCQHLFCAESSLNPRYVRLYFPVLQTERAARLTLKPLLAGEVIAIDKYSTTTKRI